MQTQMRKTARTVVAYLRVLYNFCAGPLPNDRKKKMVEGKNRTMDRGQNLTAAQMTALEETIGLDSGLLQTAISTSGSTGKPP